MGNTAKKKNDQNWKNQKAKAFRNFKTPNFFFFGWRFTYGKSYPSKQGSGAAPPQNPYLKQTFLAMVDMMNNISMDVNIKVIFMTKFVALSMMVELSIRDSFLDPQHNCGGHDEQHLHGGQHQGHPHDQVCVTLQDGGVVHLWFFSRPSWFFSRLSTLV